MSHAVTDNRLDSNPRPLLQEFAGDPETDQGSYTVCRMIIHVFLDHLRVGTRTRTNLIYCTSPTFLFFFYMLAGWKLNDGWKTSTIVTAVGRASRAPLLCPVKDIEACFEYATRTYCNQKRVFFLFYFPYYFFFNIVRGKASCSADSKSGAMQKFRLHFAFLQSATSANSTSSSSNEYKLFCKYWKHWNWKKAFVKKIIKKKTEKFKSGVTL